MITLTNRSSWITTSKSLRRPQRPQFQIQWTVSIRIFQLCGCLWVGRWMAPLGSFLGSDFTGCVGCVLMESLFQSSGSRKVARDCWNAKENLSAFSLSIERCTVVCDWSRGVRSLSSLVVASCSKSLKIKHQTWRDPLRLWAEFANSGSSLSRLGNRFLWSKWYCFKSVFLCFPAFSGWDFSSIFFNQILASKMEADGNPNLALQFLTSVITLGIVFFCVLGAFLG